MFSVLCFVSCFVLSVSDTCVTFPQPAGLMTTLRQLTRLVPTGPGVENEPITNPRTRDHGIYLNLQVVSDSLLDQLVTVLGIRVTSLAVFGKHRQRGETTDAHALVM